MSWAGIWKKRLDNCERIQTFPGRTRLPKTHIHFECAYFNTQLTILGIRKVRCSHIYVIFIMWISMLVRQHVYVVSVLRHMCGNEIQSCPWGHGQCLARPVLLFPGGHIQAGHCPWLARLLARPSHSEGTGNGWPYHWLDHNIVRRRKWRGGVKVCNPTVVPG